MGRCRKITDEDYDKWRRKETRGNEHLKNRRKEGCEKEEEERQ